MAELGGIMLRDPTLEAVDKALEEQDRKESRRGYLGASSIGHPCERKLWYDFRWTTTRVIPAKGLRAIADGHRTEELTAERLRMVPGLELWTVDPESGRQIGFTDFAGHFAGNCDGLIVGLLQAPVALHVWENKAVNEAKQNKLEKLKFELGEKKALEKWDPVYWGQGQIYMHYLGAERHYLTCDSPGGRSTISVRTNYDAKAALTLIAKAERIIFADRPGARLSDRPDWFECRFCDHHGTCHGTTLPEVNCRTCMHSTPTPEGTWHCARFDNVRTFEEQIAGCRHHLFHPDFIKGKPTGGSEDHVEYAMEDGSTWIDGEK